MPESIHVSIPSERRCPFITFYSFKGGVGRSMAVINVAGIMASRGFRVLVIDMDLEAPGLSFLTNQSPSEGDPPRLQPGFVDFMLDAIEREAEGDIFTLSAKDAIHRYCAPYELPEEFRRDPDGSLHIMPAGLLDDGYAGRLTRLDLPSLYLDGTGLALVHAFKQIIQDSKQFDYVFVDSRTGFSDESGICTRDLADCLMIVSGLNKQNVEGTTRFLSTLRQATDERRPLEVILSPIPNGEDALVDTRAEQARQVFDEAWGEPVRTELQIPYHPQLALTEEPHIFRRRRGYLFDAYNRVEGSVLNLLGESWNGAVDAAVAALKDKNHTAAESLLRHASKLAVKHEWADFAAFKLDPLQLTDRNADGIVRFLVERGGSTATESLAWAVQSEAFRQQEKAPNIAKALHERSLEFSQSDPNVLGNYAYFLRHVQRDVDGAEAMLNRALEAHPTHAGILGYYALLLFIERADRDAAEAMYERALEADRKDANNLGNYGSFCLSTGRVDEGLELVERALTLRADTPSRMELDAELWMYVYCCATPGRRADALRRLRTFVEAHLIRTGDWDFSGVIAQARAMNHPEADRLPALAEVLAGRQPPSTLDDWPAWRAAAP